MQTSTIKFSQIEDRIDAEYYKPEFLEIYNNLEKKKNVVLLKDIAEHIVSGSYIDTYFPKGILYLRVNNLKEDGFELDDTKYVDIQFSKIPQKIRVNVGDLVLGRTGTIGVVLIIPDELDGAVMSQHITKIIPKNIINKYFLTIYLNSKYGKLQAQKTALGSMQKELTLEVTKNFKILIPSQSFQQKIEKMVKNAQEKRILADEKYKEAEEILNKELGLEDLDLSTQKTFETKFSEAEDRFDPEYYQPKYKKIKGLLSEKKLKVKLLKSFVKKYNCGFAFPTETYLEKGIPLLRIKNLKRIEIDFKGVELLPDLDEYQEFVAKSGDILISMSGTVGATSLVPENIQKAFVNQRITSISTEGIDKLYLCFYLNLQAINSLMVGGTTGGVQKNITYQDIVSIPVPTLSQSFQQKISSLIQQSFKLRQEAKELIDRAKKEVEEMIEK